MVKATLNEDGTRIEVRFPYDPAAVARIKAVAGRAFVPAEKGGPHWTVPASIESARDLREAMGPEMILSEKLKSWGRAEVVREHELHSLARADTGEAPLLEATLPGLHQLVSGREYQLADIALMARENTLNANQPGMGKTAETLGAIAEAGLIEGQHLIIAPKTSLDVVWRDHIEKWVPGHPVVTFSGDLSQAERGDARRIIEEAGGGPLWLVTTPDRLRAGLDTIAPGLGRNRWASVTVDEFHKMGLSNTRSAFHKAINKVLAERRFALSGTPMGGRPSSLWGVLHWLAPARYSRKWDWYRKWLDVRHNGFGWEVGGILPGREDAFYASMAQHLVRRTKDECMPWLPPKTYVDVWVPMGARQRKQYKQMSDDAELRIDEQHLSATSVLAEYTRLKQLAGARCEIDVLITDDKEQVSLKPTADSPKLAYLLDRLGDHGILPEGSEGRDPEARAIVGTQFKKYAHVVSLYLTDKGISHVMLTGDTKAKDRENAVRMFQRDAGPQVIVMTTTAGGVSVTLDRAASVHILDETWNPDDQEQLSDRAHRGDKRTNVTVYTYRTRASIEEQIAEVTSEKAITNKNILDLRRAGFRSGEAAPVEA